MVNTIGRYSGRRPLAGGQSYVFDITANGAWTIEASTISAQPDAARVFAGRGDSVSGLFAPLGSAQPYEFTHDGQSNFAIWFQCDSGRVLAQNEIGPVGGSRVIATPRGAKACFWEVEADGNWSINAR